MNERNSKEGTVRNPKCYEFLELEGEYREKSQLLQNCDVIL